MKVRLQSYPRLDTVTSVHKGDQPITAVLEVPHYFAEEHWEVVVWHSKDGNNWSPFNLKRLHDGNRPVDLQGGSPNVSRLSFQGTLSFKSSVQFTLKFRYRDDQPWEWARDEYGLDDGYIALRHTASSSSASDITKLIPNLNEDWAVSSLLSQSPETQLWSIKADIPSSNDNVSAFKDLDIGTPFGSFYRWFALVRNSSAWLAPRKGNSQLYLDKEAMICAFQNKGGQNLVFMAVSGIDDVQSLFCSSRPDCISVHARNDATSPKKILILVSVGCEFERTLAAVVYHARSLIWHLPQKTLTSNALAEIKPSTDKEDKEAVGTTVSWRERWYDGLGYCTWNSLGPDLTEERILNVLAKLEEDGIRISNLIIDDNWQSIDTSDKGSSGHAQPSWLQFEANKKGFPGGLRQTVSKIRLQHRSVENIGVWHALLGYWGGISPRGEIAKTYSTVNTILDTGDRMTVIAKDGISKFYDDFYSFLVQSGINLVKADAQCLLDSFEDASARLELTNAYLDKWSITALRHFGVNAISCMSQFPQAIFHAHMPQLRPPVVMRNSDDYFPNVPTSHRWHIWANAHNAMLTQYLNVMPDWDMFQTEHEYGHYHAAARCVSGGPIYITDEPGRHDLQLIGEMSAITPLGKTVILRPSVIGKALDPYLENDGRFLLQVGGYQGASETGTSMVSVFQTSDARNFELIPLNKFPGITRPAGYVVRAYTTGHVEQVRLTEIAMPIVLVRASERGYEIYSVFPSQEFLGKTYGMIELASFGLVDKMTGCAAVVSSTIKSFQDQRITVVTRLKALGVLGKLIPPATIKLIEGANRAAVGVYISTLPKMTIDDDFMVTIADVPVPRHTVNIAKQNSRVLEVDVLSAWREMGLDAGWSNEVEIKVFFDS